jgi:hypothetical protein
METQRHWVILIITAVIVWGLVALGLRNRVWHSRSQPVPQSRVDPFTEAREQAFAAIRQRERWPPAPEAVCRAFWAARAARNYAEMAVLWPGTAAWNWPEICRKDPNVVYVFGPAGGDGTAVPYASQDHFDAQGTYNLTMHLRVLPTGRGPRYYIVSGN